MSSGDWAQLVSTTDTDTDPIMITKDKYIIGRGKNADLCLMGNKMVSGIHCFIERDDSGQAWLQDVSTNGTLLNLTKKVTGQRVKLDHGDEIHIVYKKDQPEVTVAYLYQDLEMLAKEEADATLECSSDFECAEEFDKTVPVEYDLETDMKRSAESPTAEPAAKRRKEDNEEKSEGEKRKKISKTSTIATGESAPDRVAEPVEKEKNKEMKDKDIGKEKDTPEEEDAIGENLICIICQDILHDCISLQPCMHSFCSGCYSDWMKRCDECPTCRKKVDRINKNHIVNNLVEAYLKGHPQKRRSEEDLKELEAKNKITKDMLYTDVEHEDADDDCYDNEDEDDDGSGLSDSDDGSGTVGGVPYIPFGGLYTTPKTVCRQCPEYKGPVGSATTVMGQALTAVGNVVSKVVNLGAGTGASATAETSGGDNPQPGPSGNTDSYDKRDFKGMFTFEVRMGGVGCLTSLRINLTMFNVLSMADQPSTSTGTTGCSTTGGVKAMPTPPAYVCKATENHLLCQCCLQPMPNRKFMRGNNPDFPYQQCPLCYGHYCHLYWGCRKVDCNGCIGKFKDLIFTDKNLINLILENHYESEVFKNYLEDKSISVRKVFEVCCQKLDDGSFTSLERARIGPAFDSNYVMCFRCGYRTFRELSYQYRRDISSDQFPVAVTSRPDCYWGKNCRTQKSKPQHAARYNHICEQSRTG